MEAFSHHLILLKNYLLIYIFAIIDFYIYSADNNPFCQDFNPFLNYLLGFIVVDDKLININDVLSLKNISNMI